MSIDHLAEQDFERAVRKSFWRKILTRFRGETNELLPYDDVREKIQIQGQRYIGLREVPVDLIVGSVGRYRDFDRQFLPVQRRTRGRWVNIDKAHYEQIPLPPVELYKVGEIYFVKDGNHRVSVARERGQDYVDAYITEIDLPVILTPDMSLADLDLKKEKAEFMAMQQMLRKTLSSRFRQPMPTRFWAMLVQFLRVQASILMIKVLIYLLDKQFLKAISIIWVFQITNTEVQPLMRLSRWMRPISSIVKMYPLAIRWAHI